MLQVDHEDRLEEARHVYEDANKKLRQNGEKEERLMLLEAWKQFEKELYQVWFMKFKLFEIKQKSLRVNYEFCYTLWPFILLF